MEHDVCGVRGGPADRLRITPTLVADGDAERQGAGLEHASPGAGRVGTLLGGVDLDLVLETGERSISVDDQGRDQEPTIDDAFGAENDGDVRLRRGPRDGGPGPFEKGRIGGR